jgi:TRAP-type mannitol/chloroaromatic compound transport system permease large subunit
VRLAEDLLDSMGQLFGTLRGGIGYSVIIVGFVLGAITGTVAAQVIAMALISLPVMMRYKYNMRYATGVLAASGTITQLVPPSLVLIVLADQLGRSVGDMYLGAWGPSLLQIALFLLFTFAISVVKPEWVPAIPKSDLSLHGWALWKRCLWGIIPAAVLIFLVLGSLLMGWRRRPRAARWDRSARSCSRDPPSAARPVGQALATIGLVPPASPRSSACWRFKSCRSRWRSRCSTRPSYLCVRAAAIPTCAS